MSLVGRYLVDLLRPSQILGYMSACWLVSSADEDRRSGRTMVLAAAHLTEVLRNRSSKIWDHAADGEKGWMSVASPYLDHLLDQLDLTSPQIKGGILRTVSHKKGADPRSVLRNDADMSFLGLRESVRLAVRSGVPHKTIVEFVKRTLREDLVDEVHGL